MSGVGTFALIIDKAGVTLSNFTAIPEPTTYVLLSTGLLVLIRAARRR